MANDNTVTRHIGNLSQSVGDRIVVVTLFVIALVLYVSTAAQGTIFGDPSEYQFIPAIWGIAHPPGYAFYTLVAGVWQRMIPLGSVAWRTHLLACVMGAWTVSRIAAILFSLIRSQQNDESRGWRARMAVLIAGTALMLAPDIWQHSIHSNAHIMSAAISATQLWLCVQWYVADRDAWLYALAFSCGIGVTHHPITVWSLPAYALYILIRRPKIWRDWRMILIFLISGLAGLLPWLYFPLRSPYVAFGPTDMATWEGFLRHGTAQGLRVNLFHFGLADQWNRLRVFWTLARLQYPLGLLLLIIPGLWLLWRKHRAYALVILGFLAGHLLFTLNSVQDVMAYLLHPFIALAIAAGYGVWLILAGQTTTKRGRLLAGMTGLVMLASMWLPALLTTRSDISLREWDDADRYVAWLRDRFEGTGEGAAIVSDWEHLTPYYYQSFVDGKSANADDYRPVVVSGSTPWVESVFGSLAAGPTYLTNYRRDVRELGFRLRPVGPLWQVLEPPATDPVQPDVILPDVWVDEKLQVVGYDLDLSAPVHAGDIIPLTLYATVPEVVEDLYLPSVAFADVQQEWMTDSKLLSVSWQAGEIIAEQYEIYIPYGLSSGVYPLMLRYTNESASRMDVFTENGNRQTALNLGNLVVEPSNADRQVRTLRTSLTNVGNDVALSWVAVRSGLQVRYDNTWDKPLTLADNRVINLTLRWDVLAQPRKNYTIFIHLMNSQGQPVYGHDYTPLGGAFPSYLWFPKWLPGQSVVDPYRLVIPGEVASGAYNLEVGIYEMGSIRRIPQLDMYGNMTGDRLILGTVVIE